MSKSQLEQALSAVLDLAAIVNRAVESGHISPAVADRVREAAIAAGCEVQRALAWDRAGDSMRRTGYINRNVVREFGDILRETPANVVYFRLRVHDDDPPRAA